ncbi:enoyl-CoA hydratase-related protein [Acidiplasma sp.]|uniref:enoyl-CoA hydratase-related protein n=1 Tax=Acidiplasma sp. TaxID=1872114 RepID=UPI003162B3D2
MEATEGKIEVKMEDDIEIINIENEGKRNALSKNVLILLYNELNNVSKNKNIKVIIIRSNGPVFSSGHDLNEILADTGEVMDLFNVCGNMMKLIRKIPQIVIASVQGIATAAGCQLVAACDLAICSESAKFATPGIQEGLFCSTPSVYTTRNIPLKKATELLFTANYLSSEEALMYGLVNRIAKDEDLYKETIKFAKEITRFDFNVIALGKNELYKQLEMSTENALDFATNVIVYNSTMKEAKEGINNFLHRRKKENHI